MAPGVEVSIVPCLNGIPQIQEMGTIRPQEPTEHGARFSPRFEIARCEWGEIVATNDASVETKFVFDNPIQLQTDYEYGIVIKYDGTEDFILWYSYAGDLLLGSTTVSPGASNKYVGNLYDYIGPPDININNLDNSASSNNAAATATQTNTSQPVLVPDGSYLASNWKPLNGKDLKFSVYVARYFHQGYPVSANVSLLNNPIYASKFQSDFPPVQVANGIVQITAPSVTQEYFKYDVVHSDTTNILAGDYVFQPQVQYPANQKTKATASVDANTLIITANGSFTYSNGQTFNSANGFNNLFVQNAAQPEYIVLDYGTAWDVRQVVGIISNTQIVVTKPPTVTNAVANFYKAPVGSIAGLTDTYLDGQDSSILILDDSNANSSLRFVNNYLTSATASVGGTGYSNNDYVTISGYEQTTTVKGGYSAKVLLTTNSTGGIVNTFISNTGSGFVYPGNLTGANVVVSNSTGGTTTGSGATFAFTVGSSLICDGMNDVTFANAIVTDIIASRIRPEITVNNPLGTAYTITHRGCFYSVPDANNFSGRATMVYTDPSVTDITVKIFKSTAVGDDDVVATCMPSRSNQLVATYANGAIANASVIGQTYSNAAVYLFNVSSNNDYTCPFIEPQITRSHYSKYVINNDYTNENTNYGNAYAKHITTKVNFATDQFAEDMLVYLTAYRPSGSDFAVFARIQNSSKDSDAFDDKDWTLLQQTDGLGVYSSAADETDYIELTYNFPNCPNNVVLNGTVSISNTTTTNVVGSNTTFSTSIANGDLIVVTNPLFSQNSFAVCVVNSVVNNTLLSIQAPITNTGVVGSGFQIGHVSYPKQAFNNVLNANVVEYFDDNQSVVDTYDTFQMKIVFLSNNDLVIPKIDDIRGVGVSA